MVREVSEDQIYDTIEFNEFLQMMSKQQSNSLTEDSLKDAFRYANTYHQSNYQLLVKKPSSTVGRHMSGTAGQMFLSQKEKPLRIS